MKNVREIIFKPVGLQSAVTSVDEFAKSPNVALGHADSKTVWPKTINGWTDAIAPAGAISMNIGDRLKWIEFLMNKGTTSDGKTILKPETFQQIFYPHSLKHFEVTEPIQVAGLGIFITTYRGETVLNHGGKVIGGHSLTCFLPDRKFGVVSLYSGQDFGQDRFCYDVIDRLLFKDSKTLKHTFSFQEKQKESMAAHQKSLVDAFNGRNKDTKPSFTLTESLGEYSNPVLGPVAIQKSNVPDALFELDLKIPIIPRIPLVHFEKDQFVAPPQTGKKNPLEFKVRNGAVQGFTFQLDGNEEAKLYFTKTA
ncbi:beta-lactamase/transpeptidase-like protein [Globomyces pollinis-pini]|nr:beta-lactamase/transpeptidase-like protein [Globomyces pollinis-pini]